MMGTVSRGSFQTSDGVRLSYLESGSGLPLLFVPGWTMPASVWKPQLLGLGNQYRVIAMDPRGHGESELTERGQFTERRAQDIHEMIAALDLSDVVLVAWSMAVGEAIAFVQQFGVASLRALVLVDGVIRTPSEMWEQSYGWARPFLRDRESWSKSFIEMIAPPQANASERAELLAQSLRTPASAAYSLLLDYCFSDSSPALALFSKPLLYAHCPMMAGQDALVLALAPNSECVSFQDAGHMFFVSHADKFNGILREFIDDI